MKKVLSILIVAALLMSLMVSAFAADTETPVVTVSSATAEVGEEITLDVSITAVTMAGYEAKVVYNNEALELTAITQGAASNGFFSSTVSTGKVTYATYPNTNAEGVLFTLTFKVLAAGEHTVGLENVLFGLADQTSFDVETVAGVISVAEEGGEVETPVVTVSSATAAVGEEVTLDVSITAVTMAGYEAKVVFDSEALELIAITQGAASNGFFSSTVSTGKVTYATYPDTNAEGVLFTLTFKVLAAGEHTVGLENVLFGKADQTSFEVETVAGVISVADEGGEEEPVEGSIVVETTDTYGYFDMYTFTADATGTYTFFFPAGLGAITAEALQNWGAPIIDFYDNTEGYEYSIDLAAGEEFVFYVGALTKGEWTITWTFVPAGGETPDPGPGPEPGDNTLVLGTNNAQGDVEYTFTPEADGTLTIDASTGLFDFGTMMTDMAFDGGYYNYGYLKLVVNGEYVDVNAGGVTDIAVTAGVAVTIKVEVNNASYVNVRPVIVLTLTEGGETPDPGPGPEPGNNTLVLGDNDAEAEVEYTFTAEANGTLTIDATTGSFMFYGSAASISGSYYNYGYLTLYVDGVAVDGANMGVATVAVTAGQVVTVKVVNNNNYQELTLVIKLSLVEGSETPDPEKCEHEFVDGVCVKCGAEDPNYEPPVQEPDGTSGNPFIIEELPYDAEQTADQDLYYKWTATENGTLYVTHADGSVLLTGSSVGSWEYCDGGKCIKVAAGDVITINYWNGTGFTVTFVADSGEAEPGTEANPIEIESLNITLTKNDNEIYYVWYATEAGEVVIRVAECTWGYGIVLSINGETLQYAAGSEMTLNLAEGDAVVIMLTVYASASSDGHLTLEQVVEEEHVCEFVITDSQDATCTEDGYVTYTCECGETYTEVITATGHTHVITDSQDATCGEDGYVTYTCECGDTYTEVIPATGEHNFVEGVCTECGAEDPNYVPECEHNFVDGVCTECGAEDPDYNPGTGSMNVLALGLITVMSVAAVVVTASKKEDEE